MPTVGVGVIGSGVRMQGVLQCLRLATRDVSLVAIADPDPQAVAVTRETYNPAATVYADYHDLVGDPAVDWVLVGSWNSCHAEQVVAAFEAGKHVFCEKPLATTLEDCLAMRDAWQASGKHFAIGFTLRYSPHYRAIRQLLTDGVIGELISMEFNEVVGLGHGATIHSNWRRFTRFAGTHLLEKCCHDIDLANWFTGSLAMRVASFGGRSFFTPERLDQFNDAAPQNPEAQRMTDWCENVLDHSRPHSFTCEKDIVDHQVAIIEYANKVRATFHANCAGGIPERRMYLCGTLGAIRADVITGHIEVGHLVDNGIIHKHTHNATGSHGGGDEVLGKELGEMMTAGIPPHTSLLDGLTSAITCFAIDEALDTGNIVDLHPWWERAEILPSSPVK